MIVVGIAVAKLITLVGAIGWTPITLGLGAVLGVKVVEEVFGVDAAKAVQKYLDSKK